MCGAEDRLPQTSSENHRTTVDQQSMGTTVRGNTPISPLSETLAVSVLVFSGADPEGPISNDLTLHDPLHHAGRVRFCQILKGRPHWRVYFDV